jgi:hypothetical protein
MPIFYSFSRCKNLAEKGTFCGKWKIAIAQRKHKNAQTIIIIIIPRQIFWKEKGVQSRSTKSYKRFACKITKSYDSIPFLFLCICASRLHSVNLYSNSTYRYRMYDKE